MYDMAIIVRCCCCNVRTGSIWAASYSLITSLLNVGLYAYFTVIYQNMESGYLHIPYIVFPITTGCSGLVFMLSIVLIIGLIMDHKKLLLPWIIFYIFYILAEGATSFVLVFFFGAHAMNLFALAWFVSRTILGVYCIICVVSQYQELNEGRGRSYDYERDAYMDDDADAPPETIESPRVMKFTIHGDQTQRQYSTASTKSAGDIELEETRSYSTPRRHPRSPKIVPREVQTPNNGYQNRYFEDDVF
ncbi:uncharacterized protein LOC100371028 [Saccoglossus kowalevskii]|uniref:Uncharacterized protein LOC100371028 n=1 Tax=Saccoglossus kowalevskii TaxID=10224 RepID=A0ABM0GXW9_SACKO|nr:PREDICTED: uncharacterized protein LOC100371028 [Saccoglossus kowalevskii]